MWLGQGVASIAPSIPRGLTCCNIGCRDGALDDPVGAVHRVGKDERLECGKGEKGGHGSSWVRR